MHLILQIVLSIAISAGSIAVYSSNLTQNRKSFFLLIFIVLTLIPLLAN